MIVRIKKKWVRAALILTQGLIANKNKHTHIHARAQICMKVAFKLQARKGEVLESKKKNRNFQ